MLNLVVKVRITVDPSATASYIAGFLLVTAFIWYRQRKRGL